MLLPEFRVKARAFSSKTTDPLPVLYFASVVPPRTTNKRDVSIPWSKPSQFVTAILPRFVQTLLQVHSTESPQRVEHVFERTECVEYLAAVEASTCL